MTYPTNDVIQAALVSYLKGKATVTVEVTSAEIREDQWQGTDFIYPNARIKMINNVPERGAACSRGKVDLSILVHTQDDSSRNADRIAGIINDVLHDIQFSSSDLNVHLVTTNLVPAIRSDVRTWRSEVRMSGSVSRNG
jgi:hypothetical protein